MIKIGFRFDTVIKIKSLEKSDDIANQITNETMMIRLGFPEKI